MKIKTLNMQLFFWSEVTEHLAIAVAVSLSLLLTGGLPRVGFLLSCRPTPAEPCGVANSRISPVLVAGAVPGWSTSLLGLVKITIWWSSPRPMPPEFSRVSKSASRSSDVCPVIRVSDMAPCVSPEGRDRPSPDFDCLTGAAGGEGHRLRCWRLRVVNSSQSL